LRIIMYVIVYTKLGIKCHEKYTFSRDNLTFFYRKAKTVG